MEDFIIHFLARRETPEDVQKLKEWLAEDPPARRDELKQWLVAWDAAGMDNIDVEKAYQRFMFQIAKEKNSQQKSVFQTILRIAAIFVISFSLGLMSHYYFAKNQPEQVAFIEYIVPLGSKSEIKLSDGTTVWLNAGSVLTYPDNYGKKRRDVYLSGEAYFSVARQTGKPFIAHTALATITVLGTEFNIKAYPEENMVETILVQGELAVETDESGRKLLKPGDKMTLAMIDNQPEITIAQLEPEVAQAVVSWKERNWLIDSMPLHELAVQLERRYDARITLDEGLNNVRFNGSVEEETLEQLLHIMQHILPIRYVINGKNVEIRLAEER